MYISLSGDFPNIGDAVIRRTVLQWMRHSDSVDAFVGSADESWVRHVGLVQPWDTIRRGHGGMCRWIAAAVFSRRRPVLVLEPGEVSLSRWNLPREVFLLGALLLVRLRGGASVLPPRAVTRRREASPWPLTVGVHRLSCRVAGHVAWRDRGSLDLIGRGDLLPDIGFAAGLRAGRGWEQRSLAMVTMRGRRPLPGPEWFDGIRRFGRAGGLTLVTFAQVAGDEDRARQIALGLGAEHIPWNSQPEQHEETLRQLYDQSKIVISDRLHVLILAALSGAVPAELAESPAEKIRTHFGCIGLHGVSIDARGLDSEAVANALSGATERRDEVAMRVLYATRQLDRARDSIDAALEKLSGKQ